MSLSFIGRMATGSLVAAVGICALTAFPKIAQAQTVVYDNGSPTGTDARNISDFAIVDDFEVASSLTFNAIRFYAMDVPPGLMGDFSGSLHWYLYSGSAGSPSPNAIPSASPFTQGFVTGGSITVTNTGNVLNGLPSREIAQLEFSIPTQTLGTGTYWLRLKEGSGALGFDGTPIFWVQTGAVITGNGFRSDPSEIAPSAWNQDGTATTVDLSYQLLFTGSSAPEPGTLALIALGMLGGIVARRRK